MDLYETACCIGLTSFDAFALISAIGETEGDSCRNSFTCGAHHSWPVGTLSAYKQYPRLCFADESGPVDDLHENLPLVLTEVTRDPVLL